MKRLNGKGETIVEVLISIAVVAGVLAGAYTVINRSYRQSQDAAERVAATKAAESKAEILRSIEKTSITTLSKFCLDNTTLAAVDASTSTADPSCKVDPRYTVTLEKLNDTYVVTASWNGLLADKEEVKIYYKP